MRKNIFTLSTAAVAFALMTGCVGGNAAVKESTFVEDCEYRTSIYAPISQQTLEGVCELKRWTASDGSLLLLISVTDSIVVKTSLHSEEVLVQRLQSKPSKLVNEEALWQEFQSKQSLEELDRQLDDAFK